MPYEVVDPAEFNKIEKESKKGPPKTQEQFLPEDAPLINVDTRALFKQAAVEQGGIARGKEIFYTAPGDAEEGSWTVGEVYGDEVTLVQIDHEPRTPDEKVGIRTIKVSLKDLLEYKVRNPLVRKSLDEDQEKKAA